MKTIPSIFAVAAVALGGNAMAQTYVPSSSSNGPSDLFVTVFDPDITNTPSPSLVEDLGIGQDGDPNTTAQGGVLPVFDPTKSFSIQLDGTAANFTSQTAGATVFGVFGGNVIPTSGVLTGETFVTTTNVANPSVQNNSTTNGRITTANYVDNFLSAANNGNGVTTLVKGAGNGQNWANQTGGSFGFAANPTAAIGSDINFYTFTTSSDVNTDASDVSQFAGHWNLSATGLLTWTPDAGSSPVPLPAAVWMLLSGLLGLGSIARPSRRAAGPV